MVDFYFSYRSPYSYFILPRVINLKAEGITINFKLVYPLAIRQPSFFKGKNFITYFSHKILDMRSVAKQQGMPFFIPKPDPIKQNIFTGKVNKHQPYIYDLCHLGQQGHKEGVGIELAYEISSMIFGTKKGWNEEQNLIKACKNVGLDYLELSEKAKINEKKLIKQIEQNQHDQRQAGHHGVPGLVYKDHYYFGQDKFNEFKQALVNDSLLKA